MRLLAATGNRDKLKEIRRILSPLGVEVISPAEAGVTADVEETGATFAENAELKARALYERTGIPTVADDSGLCIDALDGRPGVYSARYKGENASYKEKIAGLLEELEGVPSELRTARFVAAVCCVPDVDTVIACEGVCEGRIAAGPAGSGGFGYDPIFLVGDKTFAQLGSGEKDGLSHRGRALRGFAARLKEYIDAKGDALRSRENNGQGCVGLPIRLRR